MDLVILQKKTCNLQCDAIRSEHFQQDDFQPILRTHTSWTDTLRTFFFLFFLFFWKQNQYLSLMFPYKSLDIDFFTNVAKLRNQIAQKKFNKKIKTV